MSYLTAFCCIFCKLTFMSRLLLQPYILFSVPSASGGRYNRRHSYTPKSPPPNVSATGLAKDMSKLSIANDTVHPRGRGLSPRPSTKRRASTTRRSSRSGIPLFNIL